MSMKDTLIQKLEKQVDSWESRLDTLRAQFNEYKQKTAYGEASEELKEETAKRINDLQERIESARKRLSELRESGESRVREIRGQVEDWLNRNS